MADTAPTDQKLYSTLINRTFIGFLIAAFLAAFNDQCIHAAAMFFAIRTETLTPGLAISLMPILFFLPWAIFCTLAAYLSDKYSKRNMMIIWKLSEVVIALIALAGFWLGTRNPAPFHGAEHLGAWAVLACVFLMGSHSAFYVPNKYGVLPEIFPTHLLSKANGMVESASFLAVILGTAAGGIMSDEKFFKHREYIIGYFLVGTSIVGSLCALMILPMKPANPDRKFPGWNPLKLYAPLVTDLKMLFQLASRRTALCSIAFFTFMTVYMRGVMYMHGESQNPLWSELKTSLVVASVALGIGIGSPLAGILAGGKLELGMVTVGTLGMALFSAIGAVCVLLHSSIGDITLIISLMAIGFFSGFYVLPMYTMLQFRAPKGGKGSTIAASNFLNVTGAILASFLFWALQNGMHAAGLAPEVPMKDLGVSGYLSELYPPGSIEIRAFELSDIDFYDDEGVPFIRLTKRPHIIYSVREDDSAKKEPLPDDFDPAQMDGKPVAAIIQRAKNVGHNDYVTVSTYQIKSKSTGKEQLYYYLRLADAPMPKIYDNQNLPAYLFLGGSILSLVVIWLLVRQLPDLFRRTSIWLSTLGKYTVAFENSKYLPDTGSVIMVTNAHTRQHLGDIHTCCDRQVIILNGRLEHLNGDVLEGTAALKADELLLITDNAPGLTQLLSKLCDHNPTVRVLPITYRKDDKAKKAHVILHETVAPIIDLEQLQTILRA
ncbi:MAG TPA: MFS transporter [Gemmatales bacterium]|nr:MFS transporter [Gemmatales bacterium]